ncbi:MAG: ATP-dependent DNA ligase [Acidimicrobiales bacterium]
MQLPVNPPVRPMLAKSVASLDAVPNADGGVLFEPKWDGFRCIVFRDGDEVVLGSRNDRPLTRYFPELPGPLQAALPERCVIDGELVVAGPAGLDFDSLQLRLHPAESRVRKLAGEIPASFVAFDVLALGDQSLMDEPFAERRQRLEDALGEAQPPVYLTPVTSDRATAADWFKRFEGAGFDGLIAKDASLPYRPDQRVMWKVKHHRTADCAIGGFRMHKDGNGVGSLLLGLYDDAGVFHHLGVCASFTAKFRRELLSDLAPLREHALDDHPWREWADAVAQVTGGRMPGGMSRWNAQKDLSWEPLRVERVIEVEYDQLLSGRFRRVARFIRWRPDKDPADCTYDQLETIAPAELAEIFSTSA